MPSMDLVYRFLGQDVSAGREFDRMAGKTDMAKSAMGGLALGVAATAAAITVASVKMAGDFQNAVIHLQTDAGESAKNIGMVSAALLKMAGEVGVSATDLAKAMYYVESAGFHGAAGLTIMASAAKGAKVGGADVVTVADALTTALNAYRIPAGQSAQVTNELIETVRRGKTKLEDLAGSLGKVLPAAATAHVGLQQVLGAMATMTAEGTNADLAATYLRQTILQLSNPTAKAANEMKSLGLSSIDVSDHLGSRGLTSTLDLLTAAIERHMGPQGTVLIDKMKAASTNTSAFQQVLANLSPTQQTYIGALADMVGGTKSMQAALELTGASTKTFAANVAGIGAAGHTTGNQIKDWDVIQKSFNQRLSEARASAGALMITFGSALLPVVTELTGAIAGGLSSATSGLTQLITSHQAAITRFGDDLKQVGTYIARNVIPPMVQLDAFIVGQLSKAIHDISVTVEAHRAQLVLLGKEFMHVVDIARSVLLPVLKLELKVQFTQVKIVVVALIDTLAFLPRAFHDVHQAGKALSDFFSGTLVRAIGGLVSASATGFQYMADMFLTAVGAILHSAEKMFGWVPLLGPHLKAAVKAFDGFRGQADASLSGLASDASTWGATIGTALTDGMAWGIGHNTAHVLAAADATAKVVAAAMRAGGISSPSKVMRDKVGLPLAQGLASGLVKGTPQLDAETIAWLKDRISTLSKVVSADGARLGSDLSKAANLASSVSSAVTGGAALGNAYDSSTGRVGNIGQLFSSQLAQDKQFAKVMAALHKRGLSSGLMDQIGQYGPQEGLALGEALLTGSGGISIAGANAQYAQITSLGGSIGGQVSQEAYGATIKADRARLAADSKELRQSRILLADINAELKAMNKTMARSAASAVHQVRKTRRTTGQTETQILGLSGG